MRRAVEAAARGLVISIVMLLVACAEQPWLAEGQVGLTEVSERPAEKALLAGLRAYDDARYSEAEKQLGLALKTGLVSPKDRAAAHKLLGFIYCTSNRLAKCEASFRAARQADPAFALSKAEAGHPLWGPVYKRTLRGPRQG